MTRNARVDTNSALKGRAMLSSKSTSRPLPSFSFVSRRVRAHRTYRNGTMMNRKTPKMVRKSCGIASTPRSQPKLRSGGAKFAQNGQYSRYAPPTTTTTGSRTCVNPPQMKRTYPG